MMILGYILWYAIPATPFITVPLVWRFSKKGRMIKVLMGLGMAYVISFLFYHFSVNFCFPEGQLPG